MRRILAVLAVFAGLAPAHAQLDPATMSRPEIESLQRRLADARCYAGAPDGRPGDPLTRAIAACPDQRPSLRIETGMHIAQIWRVGTDARCRVLATGSEDKTVRLWSMPEGRLLRTQRLPIGDGNLGKIFAIAVSPDGAWVAAGGYDASYDIRRAHYIYVFDAATGQTVRRLGPLSSTISHLAFSPDGTKIAAALDGGQGVRIVDATSGRELMADREFGNEASRNVAFAPDGSLLAVGYDGFVRRYGPDGQRTARVNTVGGKQAFSVSVAPNGKRIAVGLRDAAAVDLFDLPDLKFVGTTEADPKSIAGIYAAAWSPDSSRFYAGGNAWSPNKRLRAFTFDGRRIGNDLDAGENTLFSLTNCRDAVAFGGADPSFGLIGADSATTYLARRHSVDMRAKIGTAFAVSDDGRLLRFGLGVRAIKPVLLDLVAGTLTDSAAILPGMHIPDITGLAVTDWDDKRTVRFGTILITLQQYESSRALAVRPDKAGFALGSDFRIRSFDANGKERWARPGPGIAWGVNLAKNGDLVVVAYGDGTIRWLRWSDGRELLAFFVNTDKKTWVAWTPSGYYTASPGAEDMIGWHVNRGWDQAADFFPASKFRDQFSRPDIVNLVLDTMDEAEAIRQANATRPVKQAARQVTDMLPPVVSILSPAEGTTLPGDEVRIDYIVRSPSGLPIDGIDAVIDGRPIATERGLGRSDEGMSALRDCLAQTGGLGRVEGGLQGCRGSRIVKLPPGVSELGLFAKTGDRAGDVVKVRVTRAAAARGVELLKPKLYAFVVGISAYPTPDLALQFAAKDARDFGNALQNQRGGLYGDVTVRLVTDGAATKAGILDGLDWLTKQVTSRDVGVVFLAGHGVLDESNRFYYLAADTSLERLRSTGLPRGDIQDALDALPGKAMLFLDACHSGAVAGRRGAVDINSVVNDFTRSERGVVMFTASTGRQVSQENVAWNNGAFTKAVIEGLGLPGQPGKADVLGNGTISTSALDVYVSERVKTLTDGRQSPVMIRPSTVPDFTMAVVR